MNADPRDRGATREAARVPCRSMVSIRDPHVGATPTYRVSESRRNSIYAHMGATRPRELSTLATAIHTPMWARLPPYWISGEPPKVRSTGL